MLFSHVKQFPTVYQLWRSTVFCIALPPPVSRYHVPASTLISSASTLRRPSCWHLRNGWTGKRIKLDRPGRFVPYRCVFWLDGLHVLLGQPKKHCTVWLIPLITRQDMPEVGPGSLFYYFWSTGELLSVASTFSFECGYGGVETNFS